MIIRLLLRIKRVDQARCAFENIKSTEHYCFHGTHLSNHNGPRCAFEISTTLHVILCYVFTLSLLSQHVCRLFVSRCLSLLFCLIFYFFLKFCTPSVSECKNTYSILLSYLCYVCVCFFLIFHSVQKRNLNKTTYRLCVYSVDASTRVFSFSLKPFFCYCFVRRNLQRIVSVGFCSDSRINVAGDQGGGMRRSRSSERIRFQCVSTSGGHMWQKVRRQQIL